MLLLVEAIFWGPFIRARWTSLVPFLLTLPIIPLSRFPEAAVEAAHLFARQTAEISRLDYLFTQFRVILTYLRLLVLPIDQNLDYEYPIYHSLFEPPVFLSFLFLSALFGLALFLLFSPRRLPRSFQPDLIGFGLLWFFLTLSIEASIIPIRDVINEYRLYLPSVGFLLAGSAAVSGFLDRWREMKIIVISLIVVVLSVATYQRNLVWKDDVTLWSDVVRKSPNRERGHYNLGLAQVEQGNFRAALAGFEKAVQLKPDRARNHNNLGLTYGKLGRHEDAIREFQIALELKPDLVQAYNGLGNTYKVLGRLDEAVREYKKALELKPDFAEAHVNLGSAYKDLGRHEEAIGEFRTALGLKPDLVQAHNGLGNVYKAMGRLDEATQEFKTALTMRPDSAELHNNLGGVYESLGRLEEAHQEFQTALKLKPDLVEAHYNLGQVYQQMGKIQEAAHAYERVLQIKPDYDAARKALKSLRQ
jgi:tetratricopeptide (TPR) repeat protein